MVVEIRARREILRAVSSVGVAVLGMSTGASASVFALASVSRTSTLISSVVEVGASSGSDSVPGVVSGVFVSAVVVFGVS